MVHKIIVVIIIVFNDITQVARGYFTTSLQAYHILPLVEVSCLSICSVT